ncbi:MAG: polyprenyl synthetase family protein [Dehalococcoidia bacterium]
MLRPAAFDLYHDGLEAELKRVVGDRQSPLHAMVRYQLGWTDQMGMPETHAASERAPGTLCLACAEAVSGDPARVMPAAAAIELAHAFGAIHDSIREGTPGGASQPKLWWVWGHAQGINAGDGMYALARLALMGLEANGVPAETVVRAVACLDRACLELCERRYVEIESESMSQGAPESVAQVLNGDVALTGCAAELGALVGGAGAGTVAALAEFGRETAAASKIRHEIHSLWTATPEARTSVVEALDKRRTLPVRYALHVATGEARARLDAAARREAVLGDERVDELLRLLEELGARSYAAQTAQRHAAEAMAALGRAELDKDAAQRLEQLANYLIGADR